ncbi:MAG: SDR family NAD(P)-dependent oxidoreductase [Ginsengibacter sp.]
MARTVFITGATSGIGKSCAEKYASNGDHVIICGRRADRLTSLKNVLEEKHKIRAYVACFDVSKKSDVFEAVNNLPKEWQKIDILINNAGLALGKDYFEEADMDDWQTMIDTNINGLLYVSRAIIPLMIKRKSGHIINIGSTAAKEVYEKGNVYCLTKSAVESISKGMRIDLLRHKIKVTAIHPGAAETEFSNVRFKGDNEQAAKTYEGFTPLSPSDIAETIFYTSSLPGHVCINDLVITCLAQANSIYINKEQ